MKRVIQTLKDYKEILILLTVIGGLLAANPGTLHKTTPVTLESISAKLDSMNTQLDGLVRVQCSKEPAKLMQVAGVKCPH